MFKHIKFIPMFALMLATLVPTSASAKVPFKAGETRGSNVTAYAPDALQTTSPERYRRAGTVVRASQLEKCVHNHRHSGQHWM
jgi:hypothetical protein